LLPGTARAMRRIEKITGRSDDMMILRGVNVFPTQIEEQILKCSGLAPHFQIELTRNGRMDDMIVHVEAMPNATNSDVRAHSAKELAHHIKSVVGVSTKVKVGDPDSVERSAGKAKRVVDNRLKG
jgi:phenylacetate-CoA ligase